MGELLEDNKGRSYVTLTWKGIRPLNGRQDKGFEELCAQLACAEKPSGSQFVRKGTPDAGVECYAVLSDGSEWAWQSKYVERLGDSQWAQIDRSVKTALEKHPKLVRYFVCVPADRADARSEGRKSALERWEDHIAKWKGWAATREMTVEFIYWGSHELLERLARPRHVGRVRFWFDVRCLDAGWFEARLDEAVRTAGPRYTAELHVCLPIAQKFEAFGRTDGFFDREKARARGIREALREVRQLKSADDTTVDAPFANAISTAEAALTAISGINMQAAGPLSFKGISEKVHDAKEAAENLSALLDERERQSEATSESKDSTAPESSYRDYPFRPRHRSLWPLISELGAARDSFEHAAQIADNSLLVLRGAWGTGKTHLLCDVARRRISAGRPTVLLMGQRFVSNGEPWSQALQQLDMSSLSAEEFVGALEAAAQAAGSRALVMVDALNEGAGQRIWPNHLAAFLAPLEKSPWIGVVLSVRSSFESLILPAEVSSHAAVVTHSGFAGHEYDATKAFFIHYHLELPSTPLLAPEFQNPQFLKTLCEGLRAKGERRLPRGLQGITAVFELYLSAVNEQLASSLDFHPLTPLVRDAVEAVTEVMLDSGESWLTLAKAREVIDPLLPGREFSRSLYRGLVTEGVLVEEVNPSPTPEVVVVIAYERFADHLIARSLLSKYLDVNDPASAFAATGGLAFICDKKRRVSPGLLEALCIQIPERTGEELMAIAPACVDRWGFGDAFRQSLVWRAHSALSDKTRRGLNAICRNRKALSDTLDVLLTVATLPEHPLNARFLDQRLRRDAMPDRDSWWSVYLYRAHGENGAADRLVDWAYSLTSNTSVDDETVDLCAVALAWMLTTSNRFLRDRATAALVNLLTGRMMAVVRLVGRFADVDDPYVTERVYAVAYGVAMRCNDSVAVGALATCVYGKVFASGNPPRHILLRDYARGVVERALHLESKIDVVLDRVRPPYESTWPTIPTEEAIKPLLPDWSKESEGRRERAWARNDIGSSVMDGDFARYVIGTNSSRIDWLSLRLEEPQWNPPPRSEDLLRALVGEFSPDERAAWEEWKAADKAYAEAVRSSSADWFSQLTNVDASRRLDILDSEVLARELERAQPPEVATLGAQRRQAIAALGMILSEQHRQRFTEIVAGQPNERESRQAPRFDLAEIQRYILWRVFDLGWTTERFGDFDRLCVGHRGRDASKAERIGKKYQWIAFHEITALVSDHYQYCEWLREEEGARAYEGPWQGHFRDIDPSCTLRSLPGGTSWRGHAVSWWDPAPYASWGEPDRPRDWVLNVDDLPHVEDLLVVTDPADGSRWVNCQGFFLWKQRPPVDRESTDVERRQLSYLCIGNLVRARDAEAYLRWAKRTGPRRRSVPEPATIYSMFLGEHAWAPASRYFQQPYHGDDGWTRPSDRCPVRLRAIAREYLREAGEFDCAIKETYRIHLPNADLVRDLGIQWSGHGGDFKDAADRVVAQDPTVRAEGPSAMLLRDDFLREFLAREELTICWAVFGEKRAFAPGFGTGPFNPWLSLSGAYVLDDGRAEGFLDHTIDEPAAEDDSAVG